MISFESQQHKCLANNDLAPESKDRDGGEPKSVNVTPSSFIPPSAVPDDVPSPSRAKELSRKLDRKLGAENWQRLRDDMMRECRRGKHRMELNEARWWTYNELDRMFPEDAGRPVVVEKAGKTAEVVPGNVSMTHSGSVVSGDDLSGLRRIPEGWPPLPGNASQQVELSWVQANRLLVVTESRGNSSIDLSKATSAAPSMSALSWLEFSVRNYSKYTDIVAKGMRDEGMRDEGSEAEGC